MADNNELKRVRDEATIISLLATAKESDGEIFIWRLVGDGKHIAKIKLEAIRKMRRDFSVVPDAGQDRLVQELMGSQSYIDLYVPDSGLLLRCPIKQTDAPFRYYLQLPEHVAQVERRKNLRLNVYDSADVKISFSKTTTAPKPMSQHFLKNCYDISSGGFSFYVSRMEAKFFQIHDPIRTIELKVGNWSGKVNAEITLVKEVEPNEQNGLTYKVWRVCCRFTQIDQVSRKYIERYIFERIKDELRAINE